VVRRPHGGRRFLILNFDLVGGIWLNWRPGGALGGKWRSLVGKVGECDVVSWHLQGHSPRLYQLRTDVLASVSKY
jgi:hypothetical protein